MHYLCAITLNQYYDMLKFSWYGGNLKFVDFDYIYVTNQ